MQGDVSRGVILLALGYPNYGNWASQLAASIHYTSETETVLLTDGKGNSEIAPQYLKHISKVITVPEECYTKDGMSNYLKAKTYLYDLSPFDETIFLDADMIWLPYKPITELFEQFKDIDYTMISRSDGPIETENNTLIHWAKPSEILETYPNVAGKHLYNLSSEFIYFKKNKRIKAFFELVKQFYIDPKVHYRDFGLQVPDELAYTLAMLHSDVKPHQNVFVPIYWEVHQRRRLPLTEMYNQFYGYSIGGNSTDPITANTFNDLAKMYSERMKLGWHYPVRSKVEFVRERTHI